LSAVDIAQLADAAECILCHEVSNNLFPNDFWEDLFIMYVLHLCVNKDVYCVYNAFG